MTRLHLVRALSLRSRGARVSLDGVRIDGQSRVAAGASLAHHVELLATTVGPYTSIGRYTKCHYADLGAYDSVAWDVTIGATGHPLDRATTHAFPYKHNLGVSDSDQPIAHPRARLDPDVWIGAHAVVMPGVAIGAGAVVGAGSVVTRDVAPYTVVAGVPARVIRTRIPEDLAERLLALAWWEWPRATLREHAVLFREPLDAELVQRLEEVGAAVRRNPTG